MQGIKHSMWESNETCALKIKDANAWIEPTVQCRGQKPGCNVSRSEQPIWEWPIPSKKGCSFEKKKVCNKTKIIQNFYSFCGLTEMQYNESISKEWIFLWISDLLSTEI